MRKIYHVALQNNMQILAHYMTLTLLDEDFREWLFGNTPATDIAHALNALLS